MSPKRTLTVLSISAALLAAPDRARAADDGEPYRILAVGGDELVDLDFVPDPNSMSSSILEIRPGTNAHEIRVVGLSPGKAAFVVQNSAGRVFRKVRYHVLKLEKYQRYETVKRLLKNVRGATVGYEGDNIVVDGKNVSAKDFARIEKLREAYPELLNLVEEP